jgi:glycosyltransferase involved in cell wall biosynthesis
MKTVLIDLTALNTSLRLRGIGRHVQQLAAGLSVIDQDAHGEVRILGLLQLDPFGNSKISEDFRDFGGEPRSRSPSRLDDQRAQWLRRVALEHAAARVQADLVHLPDSHATPLHFPSHGPLRVVTCHDLAQARVYSRSPMQRTVAAIQRHRQARRFLAADHVIAISSYTAEDLRSLFGLPAARVSVVYNGIDLARWTHQGDPQEDALVRRKYGVRDGAFALYVGHAAWRKNQSGMLRALRHAREARPDLGLQLVWAGRLGIDEASTIDREARNLGIRHAVRLLSYVSDAELASLYRSAVAHLFVSRHEGFGLTVVEAMACGCPVITTRRTALAEVAGDAAIHVEPDEHEHIGDALLRVAEDPALRQDIIRRGIARAQRFTQNRQAQETLIVYQRVLGLRP